jgi:hypothetical protein
VEDRVGLLELLRGVGVLKEAVIDQVLEGGLV